MAKLPGELPLLLEEKGEEKEKEEKEKGTPVGGGTGLSTGAHISAEFHFNAKGKVVLDEEGTPELTTARVFHVAVCPEGFREDNPSFGIPEMAWKTVPLNLRSFEAAIKRSEPEANLESIERIEEGQQIQSLRLVRVEVS